MPSIRTERVRLSPAQRAAKVRRCARRLAQGETRDSLQRVFSREEIAEAQAMLKQAGEGRQ